MSILIKNTRILNSDSESVSIAIEGDRITKIGEITDESSYDTVIIGSNYIVMHGLVNAHTHSAMTILRNIGDDLPFNSWLFDRIIPFENNLSAEDVYYGTLLGIAEMIRSGVTCFNDMYIYEDSIAQAVKETGIRANISFGPITSSARGKKESIDEKACGDFISKWGNNRNIKTSIEIHSIFLYQEESIKEAALLAKTLGVGIHTHIGETKVEVQNCYDRYGLSPVEAALSFGMFDVRVVAAHCTNISDNDIDILKEHNVNVVHCPTSNLKFGNGFSPVSKMQKLGINVALGTDSAASNNNLNMFEEMHIASLINKGIGSDPTSLNAETVIEMATKNGSVAYGFPEPYELKEGSIADIILIDTTKPHMCPLNNVGSAVVYTAQASDVDTVIVGGKILMEKGVITCIDEERVMKKARETQKRILS